MATVKASKLPDGLEIAPGYTVCCWKNLSLDPDQPNSQDWKKALEIFDARIRCRFLDPADALIAYEANYSRKKFGFAILAIDCLVIETLQGHPGRRNQSLQQEQAPFHQLPKAMECLSGLHAGPEQA